MERTVLLYVVLPSLSNIFHSLYCHSSMKVQLVECRTATNSFLSCGHVLCFKNKTHYISNGRVVSSPNFSSWPSSFFLIIVAFTSDSCTYVRLYIFSLHILKHLVVQPAPCYFQVPCKFASTRYMWSDGITWSTDENCSAAAEYQKSYSLLVAISCTVLDTWGYEPKCDNFRWSWLRIPHPRPI